MRRLFLLALALAPTAAPAAPMEITRVEDCAPAVAADPSAAREQAAIWYRLGGGTAARLCEAQALEALGADATAAQLLTGLGQNTNRAMLPDLRASVFEDAARLWTRAGRPDLARETLASADRVTAATPDRLLLRARAEAADDAWPAAEATLRALLTQQPDNALALALHAAALRRAGDPAAALTEAQQALTLAPDLPEAMFETAAALAQTGRKPEADALWLRLIETHPDSDLAPLARRNLQNISADAPAPNPPPPGQPGPRPRQVAPPPE